MLLLCLANAPARQKTLLWGLSADEERPPLWGHHNAAGAPEANRSLHAAIVLRRHARGKPQRRGLTRAPGPRSSATPLLKFPVPLSRPHL